MKKTGLEGVRIVLVGTTHPGNIGSTARAMKAMGITDLHLVKPKDFPSAIATAQASGADDLLCSAVVHDSLDDALLGVGTVYGTTGRTRHIAWPTVGPREAASEIRRKLQHDAIAIVFGPEHSGLSNEELDCCGCAIRIPTVPNFRSLNLAQAVQILAYELHTAEGEPCFVGSGALEKEDVVASASELVELRTHLMRMMKAVHYYDPGRPKLLKRRIARLLNRSALLHSEAQILRGFLTAIETKLIGTL